MSKTKQNRTNRLLKKLMQERAKATVRKCTRCGCTEAHACQPDGCYWVQGLVDVCSECASLAELNRDADRRRAPGTGLGRRP